MASAYRVGRYRNCVQHIIGGHLRIPVVHSGDDDIHGASSTGTFVGMVGGVGFYSRDRVRSVHRLRRTHAHGSSLVQRSNKGKQSARDRHVGFVTGAKNSGRGVGQDERGKLKDEHGQGVGVDDVAIQE